jgi:RNA polymerase sigma-70 factor (ECF subfamily)
VSVSKDTRVDEQALLRLAREGDTGAFGDLVEVYRSGLRAHCYRMLGSVHDADDALQDALLRAWRSLAGFEGRGSVRSWLYSIATNTALDSMKHRSRRELPVDFRPAAERLADLRGPLAEPLWLEPYPDQWLTGTVRLSPEARYEQRESLELAFLAVVQQLPPLQRAVLLLREVVGFSTAEICGQLGASRSAVNSALQRARAAAAGRLPAGSQQSALRLLGDKRTQQIVGQFADALERGDADTLITMLTADVSWSMPPYPTWFQGHAGVREFVERFPLTERWRHRPTRANGQLALAGYMFSTARDAYVAAAINVLTLDGERISAVTAFLAAETLEPPDCDRWIGGAELFARFGLPGSA